MSLSIAAVVVMFGIAILEWTRPRLRQLPIRLAGRQKRRRLQ